ncbi:MAG: transglutaminase-like domain-containing protein [Spirochaetes bacterium]|nr:transglutaminase-like domain-containing protein [Spirochaetota bacterium]
MKAGFPEPARAALSGRPSAFTRVLRAVALFAVSSQAYLYARELSLYPVFAGCFAAATVAGAVIGRTPLRAWVAVSAAVAASFAMRAAAFAGIAAARGVWPSPSTDALYAVFDETWLPFLPLWAWAAASAAMAGRKRAFIVAEAAIDLVILALSAWPQGGRRVTIYPHPSMLAGAGIVALVFSLLLLYRAAGESERSTVGKRARRALPLLVPLALLLVWLFGRYTENATASGGGLLKPTLFRFDFSQYLKLESKIELGDGLVLIVRKDPGDMNVYLRGQTLSRFDEAGNYFDSIDSGPAKDESRVLPDRPKSFPDPGWGKRVPVMQDYYVLSLEPGALVAMNRPVSVEPMRPWSGSSFSSVYGVVSSVRDASWYDESVDAPADGYDPRGSGAGNAISAEALRAFLDFGRDGRIAKLANDITAGRSTPFEKARAVETYLRDNYFYSLNPGAAPNGDKIGRFLFETKKGYCSYFAFSMALLLRASGIPSRIAVGFFVDPETEALGFFPVKENMAHAWVEAWMGPYGWIEFDPTSQTPAPGESIEFSNSVDPELFESLLKEILKNKPLPFGSVEDGAVDSPSGWQGARRAAELAARFWPLTLVALFAMVLAAGWTILALRVRTAKGRALALLAWSLVVDAAAVHGCRRKADETTQEFAARTETATGVPLRALSADFDRARFSPVVDERDAADFAARSARAARELGTKAHCLARILGFLDPRRPFRRRP